MVIGERWHRERTDIAEIVSERPGIWAHPRPRGPVRERPADETVTV